jgi:PAS domain S-box-containing protein
MCKLELRTRLTQLEHELGELDDNLATIDNPFGWPSSSSCSSKSNRIEAAADPSPSTSDQKQPLQTTLHQILEVAQLGYWQWDLETDRVSWGGRLEELHGLAPGTFTSSFQTSFEALLAKVVIADQPRLKEALERVSQQTLPVSLEYRVNWPDGTQHWLAIQSQFFLDYPAQGQSLPEPDPSPAAVATLVAIREGPAQPGAKTGCLVGICQDITARKAAEEALQQSESSFRAFFQQAAVGMARVSLQGQWLTVNQKLCELLGYTPEALGQLTFQQLTHPADLETDLGHLAQLLAGEVESYSLEKRYLCKNGQTTWVKLTVALVRDEAARPSYFIAVVEDIEQRKRLDQLKDLFISVASHELKTPLTTLDGYAQYLHRNLLNQNPAEVADDATYRKQRQAVEIMLAQSKRMNRLIGELQDFSKLQSGPLSLNLRQGVDLAALVTRVVAQQQLLVPDGSTLNLEIAPELGATIPAAQAGEGETSQDKAKAKAEEEGKGQEEGQGQVEVEGEPQLALKGEYDESRLEQVLNNLITNAFKYSPPNTRVRVGVGQRTEGEKREGLVWVRDEGYGISPDNQARLFERFYRVSSKENQGVGGLGLGLYISYQIIAAHAGQMWVESQPGKGSTFYLALPLD